MKAKWDSDAVRSGDMVRVFLQLYIVLRPSWGRRLRHSGFEGNKRAIRLNPGFIKPDERMRGAAAPRMCGAGTVHGRLAHASSAGVSSTSTIRTTGHLSKMDL